MMVARWTLLALLLCPTLAMAQSTAQVEQAVQAGDYSGAIETFRAMTPEELGNPSLWRSFSSQLFRAGATSEALDVLGEAAQRFPDEARFHYLVGYVMQQTGELTGSLSSLDRAAELGDNSPDLHFARAQALEAQERNEAARAAWQRYLETETREGKEEQRARAQAAVDAGQSLTTESVAADTVSAADAPTAAVEVVVPAIEPLPVVAESGNTDTAQWPDAALAVYAGNPAAASRDWPLAAMDYRTATAHTPTDADVWYRLGVAEALAGNTPACVAALTRARELAPSIPLFAERVAQAQARFDFEAATALDPPGFDTDPDTRRTAAIEATDAGLWLAASRARWALDDVPGQLHARNALLEGRPDRALEALMLELQSRPHDPDAWLHAAQAARLTGDLELGDWLIDVYVRIGGDASSAASVREDLERRAASQTNL